MEIRHMLTYMDSLIILYKLITNYRIEHLQKTMKRNKLKKKKKSRFNQPSNTLLLKYNRDHLIRELNMIFIMKNKKKKSKVFMKK
jgi:hypothetical protein